MEATLGVIAVASFLIAVWQFYVSERGKDRERANLTVLRERVESAANSLEATFATVNAMVQIPKKRAVTVEELQDLARVARTQVISSAKGMRHSEDLVKSWQAGKLLRDITENAGGQIVSDDEATVNAGGRPASD